MTDRAVKVSYPEFHLAFSIGGWTMEILIVLAAIFGVIHLLMTGRRDERDGAVAKKTCETNL